MYDIRATKPYLDSVRKFEHRPDVLAALQRAWMQLPQQPFGNPQLQTHGVKNCPPETYTSYVGNRGHRIIWRLVGNVIVLLVFDEHDAAYRRAQRLRVQIDDTQNILRVFDVDPATERTTPYEERRATEGTLFMAWTDRELREFGFMQHELPVLREISDESALVDLESRMRPQAFELAYNLVAFGNHEGEEVAERVREGREAVEAVTAVSGAMDDAEQVALSQALAAEGSARELIPVAPEDVQRVLAAPIEDWMVYLDPSQQGLVERQFSGPARIAGAAGTGKTVVGLHRARRAAQAEGARVLVTTFIRSIPPVLAHVFERFAPDESSYVEFKGLHAWALGLLGQTGRRMHVDLGQVDRAWRRACDRVLTSESPLARAGLTRSYLREEIDWIVKGRGFTEPDGYLALARNGRGTPLSRELRTEVWRLFGAYQAELASAHVNDFNDVLIEAHHLVLNDGITPAYTAVIVDEAQDLTEIAIRLLHAAVGEGVDGLLLVGDGQQSVYPGGFNLASLGINIRGRATRLTRNYRNTRQVLEAAMNVVSDQPYDDGGDSLENGRREVDVVRDGPTPVYQAFDDAEDQDLAVAAATEDAVSRGCGAGDVAVLVPTNRLVDHYASRIDEIGLATQRLDQYDGYPNSCVKVGTYQRAKGLEFKHVLLPGLDPRGIGEARRAGEDDDTYAERIALLRRQLFVAMTRARDELWLGWVGDPSTLIGAGRAAVLSAEKSGGG